MAMGSLLLGFSQKTWLCINAQTKNRYQYNRSLYADVCAMIFRNYKSQKLTFKYGTCFPRWLDSYGAPPRAISTKHNSVRLNPSSLPWPLRLSMCLSLSISVQNTNSHAWSRQNSVTRTKTDSFMNCPPNFRCDPLHKICTQLSVETRDLAVRHALLFLTKT